MTDERPMTDADMPDGGAQMDEQASVGAWTGAWALSSLESALAEAGVAVETRPSDPPGLLVGGRIVVRVDVGKRELVVDGFPFAYERWGEAAAFVRKAL